MGSKAGFLFLFGTNSIAVAHGFRLILLGANVMYDKKKNCSYPAQMCGKSVMWLKRVISNISLTGSNKLTRSAFSLSIEQVVGGTPEASALLIRDYS